MKYFRDKYLSRKENTELRILDLGSMEIGGSYRSIFDNEKWEYTGMDLLSGKNVDIVLSGHVHDEIFDDMDRGVSWDDIGIWDMNGATWTEGSGIKFVVTDALRNGAFREIHFNGSGEITPREEKFTLFPVRFNLKNCKVKLGVCTYYFCLEFMFLFS